MCGRFTLSQDPERLAARFGVTSVALQEFLPNFNIPPTAQVPIILQVGAHRRMETARWGLVRSWAPQIANLREEKLLSGSFRTLLVSQRCLVPADGFYEWGTRDRKKYPVWFHRKDKGLFGFPAIYDPGEIKTFSIFTTAPNAVVLPIHDRMPVILPPEAEDRWLDPAVTDAAALHTLLRTYPAEAMAGYEVSRDVSYARNNRPDLINPIA